MKKIIFLVLIFGVGSSLSAEKKFYSEGPVSKKQFALTYDDGPGFVTEDLLALLKKYGAKVSFFELGENIKKYPDRAARVYASGHLIGSHTYSHKNFFQLDKKAGKEKILEEEIKKTEEAFARAGIPKPVFLRMPNGFSKKWALDIISSKGYVTVNWTYGMDWHNMPEEKMTEGYLKALKPGAIILMHDGGGKNREKTLRITEALLKEASAKGLKPVRLDELLNLKKKETSKP